MKRSYDCVVAVGCSYTAGSNIITDPKTDAAKLRASYILANELNIPEINLAKAGAGNQFITRTVYEWIKSNTKYSNPLFLIGTSGITRKEFQSVETDKYYDLHIFDFQWNKPKEFQNSLKRRATKVSTHLDTESFEKWLRVETEFMYNDSYEKERAKRLYELLTVYIESKGYNYVIFNSLYDVVGSLKDELNFVSFNMEEGQEYSMNDVAPTRNESQLHDCWYHYLRQQHGKKYDFNDTSTRSNVAPYGEYFCGGHPSPKANYELVQRIKKYI